VRARLQASRFGATVFAVSTLVVSPLITGSGDNGKSPGAEQPTDHASHHHK